MVDRPAESRPPDVLIIGAQRAGTTSLFDALAGHSGFAPPPRRELHYFDLRYWRGGRWYRRQFRRPPGTWSGESSPYYLFHPAVPARVAADLPGVPVVALVRDPIDRAWSQYQHNRRRGREDRSFLDALAAEADLLDGCRPPRWDHSRLTDRATGRLTHRDASYAARGRYPDQLDRWADAVGRERLLVVASAELFADPASVHTLVLDHIGVADEPLPTPHRHHSPERLDAETRAEAEPFFPFLADDEAVLRERYGVGYSIDAS